MNNYYMENIDPEVFLRIGQSLMQNDAYEYYSEINSTKKSYQEYKSEYLQKLFQQIESLKEKRAILLNEYNDRIKLNENSIKKITYLNNKLGKNNNNLNLNNKLGSTTTFLSLRNLQLKKNLQETIENNISNSQKLFDLEKEISLVDLCIRKTKIFVDLNS